MTEDPEIKAMASIKDALSGLEEQTIARVLRWAADRYGVTTPTKKGVGSQSLFEPAGDSEEKRFDDVGSLYDAANPTTEPEKVLVVAYWFQEIQGQQAFDSFRVNTQLKHLGHGVKNITRALNNLMDRSPRLVIQLEKRGSAKQARKKFKITTEGLRKAKQMLVGKPADEE